MADDKAQEPVKEEVKETKKEKKEEKALSGKLGKLVDEISGLSVLELSDLVSALQDKLGVTAAIAAPVQGIAPAAETPAEGATAGGASTQTVIMTNSGGNKISVIKALREINQNLTLVDAKNMTEQVPAEIVKDAKAEDAKVAVEKLKAAGATVEVK